VSYTWSRLRFIDALTRNQIYCNFPYPIAVMVITHFNDTRETQSPLYSPGPGQTKVNEETLSASVSNETSALLPLADRRVLVSRPSLAERCQSAISPFLDKNAGLLLVALSQFFFSASNLCVKWLNSLDERIPILEVRDILGVNCYPKLTTSIG